MADCKPRMRGAVLCMADDEACCMAICKPRTKRPSGMTEPIFRMPTAAGGRNHLPKMEEGRGVV
nr:hypothetical protein [Bacillaceae bacterium]